VTVSTQCANKYRRDVIVAAVVCSKKSVAVIVQSVMIEAESPQV
jgi:hypothetical protein